jgi:pyochelin biosynthetic protein PchC
MSSEASASPWLQCYRPVPAAAARLVCFPHAGGGASFFRRWADDVPPGVEMSAVQYPGREDRLREPPATSLETVADEVARALEPVRGRPVPLVGHSLGAAVAYEVAHRLDGSGGLALLVVSGRHAPRDDGRSVHLMSDDELWTDVRQAGGTSEQVLDNPELRSIVAPVLRADYRLSETYRPVARSPLRCPILACTGSADPDVDLAVLGTWGELTVGRFVVEVFPGGHFYLVEHRRPLVAEIMRRLRESTDAPQLWPVMP